MRFDKTISEQDVEKSKDPVDQDPRIIQAQNEIARIENQLAQKKQAVYRLKASVAQNLAKQQEREMLKPAVQQQKQSVNQPTNQVGNQ
jgi:hypothetical protein